MVAGLGADDQAALDDLREHQDALGPLRERLGLGGLAVQLGDRLIDVAVDFGGRAGDARRGGEREH